LYIAGGQRLDKEFLDSLPATEGMRLQLYTTFDPLPPAKEAPLIQEVRSQARENNSKQFGRNHHGIPLFGRDRQLLAILLIENSRAELASLKNYIQGTALIVGFTGILLGLALSFWTASRVTRPLRQLASSVREVSSGKWHTRAAIESKDEVGQLRTGLQSYDRAIGGATRSHDPGGARRGLAQSWPGVWRTS